MEPNPILSRIEIDPRVCNGKPVVRGTRIPVTVVLDQLRRGESWDIVLAGYPELTRSDIEAVVDYAKAAIENRSMRNGSRIQPRAAREARASALAPGASIMPGRVRERRPG